MAFQANSTDVQRAYGWTEHTDHSKDLLVSQHKERSHLETEIQQIPVKDRGWVCHCSTYNTSC